MEISLQTPGEIAIGVAARARARRLELNLTQAGLAERAGLSLSSLKRFEGTGQITLVSLVRIAGALGGLSAFERLFGAPEIRSLDQLVERGRPRRRGRRT